MYTNYTKPSTLMTYVGYVFTYPLQQGVRSESFVVNRIYLSEWNPLAT